MHVWAFLTFGLSLLVTFNYYPTKKKKKKTIHYPTLPAKTSCSIPSTHLQGFRNYIATILESYLGGMSTILSGLLWRHSRPRKVISLLKKTYYGFFAITKPMATRTPIIILWTTWKHNENFPVVLIVNFDLEFSISGMSSQNLWKDCVGINVIHLKRSKCRFNCLRSCLCRRSLVVLKKKTRLSLVLWSE